MNSIIIADDFKLNITIATDNGMTIYQYLPLFPKFAKYLIKFTNANKYLEVKLMVAKLLCKLSY